MSAPQLRDALASLYREHFGAPVPLSHAAERAITRRVTMRWLTAASTAVVVAVVGSVGWSAVMSASNGGRAGDPAEAQVVPAVIHVPLHGGPQFEHRWGELECGDTVPPPRPEAPKQRLSIDLSTSGVGVLATASLMWDAPAQDSPARANAVIAAGAMQVVAVRDGVVEGMVILQDTRLGWQQHGQASTMTGHATLASDQFYCVSLDEQTGAYLYHDVRLDPGTYEVVAVTRVFATPESVALFQAMSDSGLVMIDERFRRGGAEYGPGSQDCQALEAQKVTIRACLPDIIATAKFDSESETIRLVYDASALPQVFDVTLVSEPLEMVVE